MASKVKPGPFFALMSILITRNIVAALERQASVEELIEADPGFLSRFQAKANQDLVKALIKLGISSDQPGLTDAELNTASNLLKEQRKLIPHVSIMCR